MKWNKYSIQTTTDAVDMISSALNDIGIEGIEIEDNVQLTKEEAKSMFVDFIPDLPPDDGRAKVNFYIDSEEDDGSMLEKVKAELEDLRMFIDIGEGTITESETEDKDWINNWKEFFKPFRVTNDIVIKPTWEILEHKEESDIVIEIDPGTAFGTGSHETTRLCIQGIEEYLNDSTKVLDLGSGSGILSIIALKLGAAKAVGTDIDPIACQVAMENAKENHIEEGKFKVYEGNVIDDETLQKEIGLKEYDMVVANILADVIIPLSAVVEKFMKKDAVFISSGIIDIKKDEVEAALIQNGFEIIKINQMGDWYSFIAKCK